MRELIYTLLDLERGSRKTCDFCSNPYGEDNKSVRQIVTRIEANGKYVSDDVVCEGCEEKFLNDELLKCERCGRLQTEYNFSFRAGKHICDCIRQNEDLEEKELPSLPYERESMSAFYERQINDLRKELNDSQETIAIEREAHEDFMKKSEEWSKRQKQELLDQIKELEKEVESLKKQTSQELVKEIEELRQQLTQLTSQKQTSQIEVKTEKKFRFFPFGNKKS